MDLKQMLIIQETGIKVGNLYIEQSYKTMRQTIILIEDDIVIVKYNSGGNSYLRIANTNIYCHIGQKGTYKSIGIMNSKTKEMFHITCNKDKPHSVEGLKPIIAIFKNFIKNYME